MESPIRVGRLINGRYELVKLLSATSMSMVFKAWDCQRQYFVAVKIATNYSVDHLKYEALALQRINHPHVVRLFDCGDVEDLYFVVLEYLHGMDLGCYLHKAIRPFFPDIALSAMFDVLEGLKAIHTEGLVHRDIKPENLMVTGAGIKIIDLGLVKFLSAADRDIKSLEIPNTAAGTPPYLSPEQTRGASNLDCRSDLYTCGVVLYQLLTGVLPFPPPKDRRKLLDYWKFPMLKFSEVRPPVIIPDKVQALVWKALQVDPTHRYQTAEEMRMALLAVLDTYSKITVS